VRVIEEYTRAVTGVSFSPDGLLLAAVCDRGAVDIWDVKTAMRSAQIARDANTALAIHFTADGRTVIVGDDSGNVVSWDPRSARRQDEFGQPERERITAIAWNAKYLARGLADGRLALLEIASKTQLWEAIGHEGQVKSLYFSGDGQVLVSLGEDGNVHIWTLRLGRSGLL